MLPSLALIAGAVLEVAYPGDFQYALKNGAPGLIVWIAGAAGVVALVVGLLRRGSPLEADYRAGRARERDIARSDPRVRFAVGSLSPHAADGVR